MFPFLTSPLVKAGLILALIMGVFGSGYLLGKRMADQSARIAELERDTRDLTNERDAARVERDTANRLMKSANDIALQAAEREQAAQAENDELEGMVREYESSLRKEAVRGCGFTATDVDRLRAIYERAFGALHPGTSTSPGMDGSAGKDRSPPTGR
jgi:hypothetical protein